MFNNCVIENKSIDRFNKHRQMKLSAQFFLIKPLFGWGLNLRLARPHALFTRPLSLASQFVLFVLANKLN